MLTGFEICERATVRLPRRGGQGVLVPGNLIVTAAHCVGWSTEGLDLMAYGDALPEPIVTGGGTRLMVDVLAVEPRADIAILGVLDEQGPWHDEAEAFEAWCNATTPVRLYAENLPPERGAPEAPDRWGPIPAALRQSVWIPAHVLSHNKGWIRARVKQVRGDAPNLVVEAEALIEGGTSGGPVIADDGRLLGVISTSGQTLEIAGRVTPCDFSIPRIHRTAPVWAVAKMTGRDVEGRG